MKKQQKLLAVVEKVIAENPGMQMGQIIGAVKQVTAGKADGAAIAALVKQKVAV
jgi:uncharacterized protein YqeY